MVRSLRSAPPAALTRGRGLCASPDADHRLPRTTAWCACLFAVPLPGADGQVCPTSFGAAQTRWTHTGWHPEKHFHHVFVRTGTCGVPRTGVPRPGVWRPGVPRTGVPRCCFQDRCAGHSSQPTAMGRPCAGLCSRGLWSLRHQFNAGEHGRPSCPEEACRWWAGRAVRRLRSRAGGEGGGAGQRAFHPRM